MKKTVFIQVRNVVLQSNLESVTFAPTVVYNICRIFFQLQMNIFFACSNEEKKEKRFEQVFKIFESEQINFEIISSFNDINYNNDESIFIITDNRNFQSGSSNCTVILFSDTSSQQKNNSFLCANNWNEIFTVLSQHLRQVSHNRNTNETRISIELNLDGTGKYNIHTGLNFFDHMLEQFSKHSNIDLSIHVNGDLHIDEHHTIEDTAIALGEAIALALGNKKGIERYGFLLPMDDALAQVAIDFGGRNWIVWNVKFNREYVGDMPTEMVYHFFKSFSDAAKCSLNITAEADNEHHKIESIFKAFAKAIKMAIKVDYTSDVLPTTKGVL